MDIKIFSVNVNRDTFNTLRECPYFSDLNGNPICKPVTSEDLDAYGIFSIPILGGHAISISVSYSRET